MNNPLVLRFISLRKAVRGYPARLLHPQHQIRRGRAVAGSSNALLLDGIVALAHTGGIEQRHWVTAEIEMHLDYVARRAGVRRHDRGLAPRQPIEQAGLA